MNRSFSQRQEIDCSCFDFGIDRRFPSYQGPTLSKPFLNARELNINFQKSTKPKTGQKYLLKKSLKRKPTNQSMQVPDTKLQPKIERNQSTDWITESKQDRWVVLAQGSIIENKKNKENARDYDKNHVPCKNVSKFKHKANAVTDFTNLNLKKRQDLSSKVKGFKSHLELFGELEVPCEKEHKQKNNKNNTFTKQSELGEVEIFSKTIKKRHSVISSIYNLTEPTQGCVKEELQTKIDQQSIREFKRVSIRGLASSNGQKYKLEYIHPKQIQSFEEENFSATQSFVIEKGRYTWAPDGSKKIEGPQFISSLHIRETDRTSKKSNRPSKMVLGNI